MKIVIIGAGAMGCLYGAYLSRHNEVIMLDSYQPQVDAINKNGITVSEEDGTEQHFSSVRACLSGEYKEDADLVIVFVKSTYTEDALKTNRKLFGEHTLVMTLQNGAGNDRKIEQYVVKKNIIIVNMGMIDVVMFNPVMIKKDTPYETEEGCLSLLGGPRKTKRYQKIKVQYQTVDFQTRLKTFNGWTAQIIQHEIDHCDGILI